MFPAPTTASPTVSLDKGQKVTSSKVFKLLYAREMYNLKCLINVHMTKSRRRDSQTTESSEGA